MIFRDYTVGPYQHDQETVEMHFAASIMLAMSSVSAERRGGRRLIAGAGKVHNTKGG